MFKELINHIVNSGLLYTVGLFGIAFITAAFVIAEERDEK